MAKDKSFSSDIPSYALIGGGAGTFELSRRLARILKDEGYGSNPTMPKDTIEKITRFAESGKGRKDLVDFVYNYAQSGSDAANAKVFNTSNKTVADSAPSLKRMIGRRIIAPTGIDKLWRHMSGGGLIDLHEAKDAMGEGHYASFALGPREAYVKMVNEAQLNGTLGDLADSILEARRNFASKNNFAGRAFKTPEEYFSWLQREVIGYASARPNRADFKRRATVGKNSNKIQRLIGKITGSPWYQYRQAMKDFNRNGGKSPVFASLFSKLEPFETKDQIVRALASGKHPVNASAEQLGRETIGSIMSKVIGDTNHWKFLPNGGVGIDGPKAKPAFRNMADMMQNRVLLQEYVDPVIGRKFRNAPRAYKTFLNAGKVLSGLANSKTRWAAGLTAATGLGTLLASKLSEKKAQDSSAFRTNPYDIAADVAMLGSAAATANYARRFKARDFNPFAKVHATLLGGTKAYDPEARDAIRKAMSIAEKAKDVFGSGDTSRIKGFVEGLEKELPSLDPIIKEQVSGISDLGKRVMAGGAVPKDVEAFLPNRVLSAMRLDSFSAQTQATADMLRRNGVKIDDHILRATTSAYNPKTKIYDPYQAYLPIEISPDRLRKSDAFVQIGMHPQEDLLRTERQRRGAKVYRVASDFGPGNFNQPETWIGGQNYMRIRDPKLYDRIVIPGKDYFEGNGLAKGMRGIKGNLGVDNIAVSPIFERETFSPNLASRTGQGRVKAMYTFGGGAGGFLGVGEPFKNEKFQYRLDKNRVFDDILDALRKKHGDNFDLDVYVGNAMDDVDVKVKGENGAYQSGELPHNRRLRKMLKKIENATLSDAERAKRGLGPMTENQKALRERFRGLHLVRGVPQSQLAKAYANSDYVFMLPGSTSAEFASIKDNPQGIRGKLISMIPDEKLEGRLKPGQSNWMARHFGTNADYIGSLVPDAKKVNLSSGTRSADILRAISEDSAPAAKKTLNTGADWRKVVGTIKRDVRLGRLGRLGKLGLLAAPFAAAGTYRASRYNDMAKEVFGKKKGTGNDKLYLGAGLAGLAGIGGLAYYLNRRRKKRKNEEEEMKKTSSDIRRDKLKRAIKTAAFRSMMTKRSGSFSKGLGSLAKAFGYGATGLGQLGAGVVEGGVRGTVLAGKGLSRYGSLLSGSRGNKLDKLRTRLAEQIALGKSNDVAALRKAVSDAKSEWGKVSLARLLTLAGLGGGGYALAQNGEFA